MPNASTVFVDTNVFLYCFDDRVQAKRDRARAWVAWCWKTRSGRVSTQVFSEFYANAVRKFSHVLPAQAAREELRRLRAWQPWPIDEDTIEGAWHLQDHHSLSYWDALVVSSAQRQGCAVLLTEDLQHEQRIDAVRVVNPFLVEPGWPEATR